MKRNKIKLGLSLCVVTAGLGMGAASGCSSPGEAPESTATVQQALLPCDPAAPFNPPIASFTGTTLIDGITFSQDGLKAYLSGKIGASNTDIFVATRPTTNDPFGALAKVADGVVSTNSSERAPSLTADGTRLYFSRYVSAGSRFNLFYATLNSSGEATSVTALGSAFNGSLHDQDPFFHAGTNKLYFAKEPEDGERDLYISDFTDPNNPTTPAALTVSPYDDYRPVLSPDGLALYFSSSRIGIGDDTGGDLWVVKRNSVSESFSWSSGQVRNLYTLNSSRIEFPAGISNDGCTLYFASNRDTSTANDFRLYEATRGTNVPSTITTTITIVGTGSIITPPYECSTTCEFEAPPDAVFFVEASDQAIWSGSCSPYGGGQSSDGAFVFSNGGTCTVTFPDGITGDAGSGCLTSTWCNTGLECTLNVCRCPPDDPNCICTPTCPSNACGAPDGCGSWCPCAPGEPCWDDFDCAAGSKCCGEICGGEGCECTAGNQCAEGLECEGGLCTPGLPPHCSNDATDEDESGTDCGGADCSPCNSGDPCIADSDCATGLECTNGICMPVTLCSNDLDCPPAFSCAHDVGAQFGLPVETDLCWPLHCNEMDPSQPGCGVDNDPLCGSCPACIPDCDGRSCGSNGCGGSCGSCAGGQACTPEGHCIAAMVPGAFYATSGHSSGFVQPLSEQSTSEVGAVPGRFSVSNRGSANYSIPLRLPPARAGFEPNLALVYTGSKHEGLMGQGWRLSGFSSISRCPTPGRPTSYTTAAFCLDGAHLVADLEAPSNASDREYRTEIDTFSKIVARGITVETGPNFSQELGPDHFEVTTKDGRQLIYGQSDNASLVSHNAKRVWALERIRDRAGNTIVFKYESRASTQGIAKRQVGEDTSELLPLAVIYNGHDSGFDGDIWVEFNYEDRPDPQFHFVDGARGFSLRRLTRVTTVVAGHPSKSYVIGYQPGNQTIVDSIKECTDLGADKVDKCIPATTFSYRATRPYDSVDANWLQLGPAGNDQTVAVLDQDGDGYSDVLVREQNGGTTFKVVRTRVQADGSILGDSIALPWTSSFTPNLIADVNRDGKDDIIDPAGRVFVSQAGSFTQQTFARPSGTVGTAVIVDFDGDGRRDYVTAQVGQGLGFFHTIASGLGDGILFSPPDAPNNCSKLLGVDVDGDRAEEVLCIPAIGGPVVAVGATRSIEGLIPKRIDTGITMQSGALAVTALDFNGDGLKDVLETRSTGWVIWENSGDGFLPRVLAVVGNNDPVVINVPSTASVLDFDGDGRDDLVVSTSAASFVFMPTGRQELTRFDAGLGRMGTSGEPALQGDINGDGNMDLLGRGSAAVQDVAFGYAGERGLLNSITNGLGAAIDISYQARTLVNGQYVRTYQPVDLSGSDPVDVACVSQMPPLVSDYVELDGPAGRRGRRFVLSYKGARVGLRGRGLYGFESRQSLLLDDQEQIASSTTYRYYNKDQARAGILSSTTIRSPTITATATSRAYFTDTVASNFVTVGSSAAGRPFPEPTGGSVVFNEVFPDIASEELARRDWTTVTNEFGDVDSITTRETVAGALVEETTKTVSYYPNDLDAWRISLPQDVTTTDTRNGETLTRQVHYDYYAESGLLQNVTRESSDAAIYLKVQLLRNNSFGNVDGIIETPLNPSTTMPERQSGIVYDDRGTFPLTMINSEGHVTELDFDPETGQARVVADPNKIYARRAFDGLGRIRKILSPDTDVTYAYQAASPLSSPVVGLVFPAMEVVETPAGGSERTTRVDVFGRVVSTDAVGFEGDVVRQEVVYDWNHRLVKQTLPHLAGDASQGLTTYGYDEAGRIRAMTAADGSVTEYLYASRKTVTPEFSAWFTGLSGLGPDAARMTAILRPRLNVEGRILDHRSNPVASVEAEGLALTEPAAAHFVTMKYGPFEFLRQIRDQRGNQTILTPDAWGRVADIDDPDFGNEHRDLSPWGEVTSVRDGNGLTRTLRRDKLGRLTEIRRDTDELIASWDYDGPATQNEVGRLVSMYREASPFSATGSTVTYHYESPLAGTLNAGRLSRIERTLDDADGSPRTLVTGFGYDGLGRVETIDYPEAPGGAAGSPPVSFKVRNEYDLASGLLKGVLDDATDKPYWEMQAASQGFRLSREEFGNGVVSTRQYYSLDTGVPECLATTELSCFPGLLRSITTGKSQPGDIQDLGYRYDRNVNLKARLSDGGTKVESFTYDGFDQLTDLTTTVSGGSPFTDSFTYDELGNIDTRTNVGAYDYTGTGLPHAVGSIGETEYRYDGNGSQWRREGPLVPGGFQELSYNEFQMPWRITTGQGAAAVDTYLEYDAFEGRIAKRSNSETTLYAGDLYERVTKANAVEHRYKVFAGSALVAQVVKTQAGNVVTDTRTTYVHDDHLGSSTVLTSESGAPEARNFGPFGDTATDFSTTSVRSGFTGHEHDGDLGLINMRGRLYDPTIGQFLQADPFINTFNPRGLNRYAYVMNNPLMNTDPSGFWVNTLFTFIRLGFEADGEDNPEEESQPGSKDVSGLYAGLELGKAKIDAAESDLNSSWGPSEAPVDLTGTSGMQGSTVGDGSAFGDAPGPGPGGGISLGTPSSEIPTGMCAGGGCLAQNAGNPSSGTDIPGNVPDERRDVPAAPPAAAPSAPATVGVAPEAFAALAALAARIGAFFEAAGEVLGAAGSAQAVVVGAVAIVPGDSVVHATARAPAAPATESEHTNNARESTRQKHEDGQARKMRDRGGEKGDRSRGFPRRPPAGHRGPWPPR